MVTICSEGKFLTQRREQGIKLNCLICSWLTGADSSNYFIVWFYQQKWWSEQQLQYGPNGHEHTLLMIRVSVFWCITGAQLCMENVKCGGGTFIDSKTLPSQTEVQKVPAPLSQSWSQLEGRLRGPRVMMWVLPTVLGMLSNRAAGQWRAQTFWRAGVKRRAL